MEMDKTVKPGIKMGKQARPLERVFPTIVKVFVLLASGGASGPALYQRLGFPYGRMA